MAVAAVGLLGVSKLLRFLETLDSAKHGAENDLTDIFELVQWGCALISSGTL